MAQLSRLGVDSMLRGIMGGEVDEEDNYSDEEGGEEVVALCWIMGDLPCTTHH